jgi:hypothetical protein
MLCLCVAFLSVYVVHLFIHNKVCQLVHSVSQFTHKCSLSTPHTHTQTNKIFVHCEFYHMFMIVYWSMAMEVLHNASNLSHYSSQFSLHNFTKRLKRVEKKIKMQPCTYPTKQNMHIPLYNPRQNVSDTWWLLVQIPIWFTGVYLLDTFNYGRLLCSTRS